ncbi:MAG: signal recognition particle-docking protein FtsY [Phycisphaerales bacterium]
MGFFKSVFTKLQQGLQRTREVLLADVRSFLPGRKVDEALLVELEAALLKGDLGPAVTKKLIDAIRKDALDGKLTRGEDVEAYLKRELKALWPAQDRSLRFAAPAADSRKPITVILVAGVNGAGKTTSVAKIAHALRGQGKTVLLAACDTFRAGAVRQLEIWSERLGIDVIKGKQGGDPAAVAFDACEAAIARGVDVLLIDTAGRLHTQDPLMRQLTKIRDITAKKIAGAPHEVLLVLDATTGQNAVRQAEEFKKAIDVTGIFLAKLDGTAKGGAVIAVHEATKIPVKFVGVGETPEDVEAFDPDQFIEALFDAEAKVAGAA